MIRASSNRVIWDCPWATICPFDFSVAIIVLPAFPGGATISNVANGVPLDMG